MALDLTRTPAPPPKRGSKETKPAAPRPGSMAAKTAEREEAVNGLFQLGAATCMLLRQPADGAAVAEHGPKIAHETAVIAETNASFAKTIDYITAVGPYAGLMTACLPLILQILANHGKVPAEPLAQFGIVTPATLTAKMAAQAAANEARMMLEAQEAQREYAEYMAQISHESDAA